MIVIVSPPSPEAMALGMLIYFSLSLFCTFLCQAHENVRRFDSTKAQQ